MNSKRKLACCLPVCKGERFDLAHKFPRDPERVLLWLKAIDCPKLNKIPIQRLGYVCSRHFRVKDYKHPLSRGINKTAIPSLNLKDLSQLHLSKDSALPHQEATSAQVLSEEQSLFRKESIVESDEKSLFQKETSVLEYIDDVPSEQFHDEFEEDKLEEAEHEISDERLSVNSFIKEKDKDYEEETNYSTVFQVSHPNYENSISLHSFWLRCHCKCPLCFDPARHRRLISPLDVHERIQPKSVKQVDNLDILLIEWDDGHKSEFDVDFLFRLEDRTTHTMPRKTWDSHSPEIREFIATEFERLVSSDKDCSGIFHSLRQLGVAVVSSIPAHSQSMAKLVLCRLFPHLQTEVVSFWEFNDTHRDISSNVKYSSIDCGLRCYFVMQDVELVLVDGFHVASTVKTLHPGAFKHLCDVQVPLDIRDNHVKCEMLAPVIELDVAEQEVLKICLDVYKIGVLNTLPQDKVEDFYDSLRLMMRRVADKENHWMLKLQPGSMVILDNNRILHKCPKTPGIWEAHIQRKDYVSRMRHLGVI